MNPRSFKYIFALFYIAFFISMLFLTCETDKSPLIPNTPRITSHEYEWEIDTLEAPGAWQTIMLDIWGIDENNVWVVGHSDDPDYNAYHWDGKTWTPEIIRFPGHPSSFNAIHGFSESDIWAVGEEVHGVPINNRKDFIVHYDGSEWRLMKNINAPPSFSVWGTSSNNLFVGSDSGIILYYDGSQWEKQYTYSPTLFLSVYGLSEKEIYATGFTKDIKSPWDTTYYYFYKIESNKWILKNSYIRTIALEPHQFGHFTLWGESNFLYSGGYGLYTLMGTQWKKIFDDNIFVWAIHGNNLNDIFAVGLFGYIFHYNGLDWHQYEQFKDKFINNKGVWMHGDYVFIIAQPNRYSVILRGKRKKGGDGP